jgi:hypothetical protein
MTVGDYTGTTQWNSGAAPGIDAGELNRLEAGIAEALGRAAGHTVLSYDVDGNLETVELYTDDTLGTLVATTTLAYTGSDLTSVEQTVNGQTITTTLAYDVDGNLETTTVAVA